MLMEMSATSTTRNYMQNVSMGTGIIPVPPTQLCFLHGSNSHGDPGLEIVAGIHVLGGDSAWKMRNRKSKDWNITHCSL